MLRGLAGNKAAALLHVAANVFTKAGGDARRGGGGAASPANVLIKGGRKDSGPGSEPGQPLRAGE